MNEALVANMTPDELVQYASIEPSIIEKFGQERFVEQMSTEVATLQDDVSYLESEVRSYVDTQDRNIAKPLYYVTWLEAKQATDEVVAALYQYCEEQKLENGHPLKAILDDLEDASRQVSDLY
ncbi:hypothetical protein NX722_07890 [Endozoicomonas gorgoniicola]|uniref:Uncharacterized protein n=1 Tax=Endozoicomonas gorgoniicola TaxID=1234144 RepID=A0ABT3MT56_9GAMM|nr:hypothetical protein [Endozoicomonas gorgoniicola]MCW7552570.1 hypothetical protein [Endozoicomonas gorgoniicola]